MLYFSSASLATSVHCLNLKQVILLTTFLCLLSAPSLAQIKGFVNPTYQKRPLTGPFVGFIANYNPFLATAYFSSVSRTASCTGRMVIPRASKLPDCKIVFDLVLLAKPVV